MSTNDKAAGQPDLSSHWLPPFLELLFPTRGAHHEPLIDDLLIQHVAYRKAMGALEELDTIDQSVLSEHCVLLTGDTRLGKTRLLAEFIAKRLPYRTEERLVIPVLYMEVSETPTIRNMSAAILREFGETAGRKESADEILLRIVTLCRNAGVRVLCMDDLHHFVDQRGETVQYTLTEWLKRLAILMRVALVISGLGRTEAAIRLNEQLYGRMDQHLQLTRFDWRKKRDRDQFSKIMCGVYSSLAEEFVIDKCDDEMTFRWYMACMGKLGYVVKIVRHALMDARRRRSKSVDISDLNRAWKRSTFGEASQSKLGQPFSKEFNVQADDRMVAEVLLAGSPEVLHHGRITASTRRKTRSAVRAAVGAR